MCVFCAAIPATAALGAKLNADQLKKEARGVRHLPIPRLTAILIGLLAICSAVYHTLTWRS